MARKIVKIKQLSEEVLPYSVDEIRARIKDENHPLPYKKIGKHLLFDIERVMKWFDSLPGVDLVDP